ncbi:hypothetical protein [Actinopolymorpha alba]|uniref:hypothetical protein n=1 Tax=Actinopolymorpha alba TaxID=533267 RepID=UPI00035CD785|nr:hypothetical protein [Actinopolymorpha alba]
MTRTLALARMRLLAYVRSQRAWMPLLATLALILGAHAGGRAVPNQAYAFSATLLFAVFGWQTKLLLDTEPDEQRMLARLAVGSGRRELLAGLLAAGAATVPAILAAILIPLAIGALQVRGPLAPWLAFGLWIHLLSAGCAVGVGALASRVVVRPAGWAAMILVAAPVAVLVFGSREAAVPRWLVPQLFAAAHIERPGELAAIGLVTAHAAAWIVVLLAGYAALRRGRT